MFGPAFSFWKRHHVLHALAVALFFLASSSSSSSLVVLAADNEDSCQNAAAAAAAAAEEEEQQQQQPLFKWLLSQEGAFFDFTKQRIVWGDINNEIEKNVVQRGVFAKSFIPQGSVLATIPESAMIVATTSTTSSSNTATDEAHFDCGTARALWDELQKEEEKAEEEKGSDDDDDDDASSSSSFFAPYLSHLRSSYLLPHQKNKLPSQYSPAAKGLFLEILGGEQFPSKLMEHSVHYVFWDWKVLCGADIGLIDDYVDDYVDDDDDEDEDEGVDELIQDSPERIRERRKQQRGIQAAMWVQQHGYNADRMIPLKDMYTHRSGRYHNVDIQLIRVDEEQQEQQSPGEKGKTRYSAQMVARRDIAPGEQLHTSYYTECAGEYCSQKKNDHEDEEEEDILTTTTTPEIFRDHGIIEALPQTWSILETQMRVPFIDEETGETMEITLNGLDMRFRLSEKEKDNGEMEIEVTFDEDHDGLDPEMYKFMDAIFRSRIEALHRLKNIEVADVNPQDYDIKPEEWEDIWEFHEAYSMALKRAVFHIHHLILEQNNTNGDDIHKHPERVCRDLDHWNDHYTDFQVELDHLAYNNPDCESSELTDFFSYQVFEKERSNYQEMLWQYRKEDDDTCLHLDGMLQICSSYRPHYHEFFVHFPAQYMKSIKRVIFLGSGDAMLLHEILKYPQLEKVVGLELDQTVTRKSFQHFKTQPHYDDPRVEWWYGDATKTLPLLPRDYWGSFDLLLVDLSETVVSLHVTGKHDVLDVISMLLKPEGVMLENELYIDKMSRHFDHTVHIFYGSPKVCVQVHTVSSNTVDFLTSPMYDHQVDMYLIDKKGGRKPSDRFRYIHDYIKVDPIAEGKCKEDAIDKITTEYGRQAGILMVLEAEHCSKGIDQDLESMIYQVLQAQGLTPVSPQRTQQQQTQQGNSTIQIVMKEGYVVARVWPELKYVGFDLHFWGAFSKMESVRAALVEALGSQTTSSYRVVVGGMHGSSTWEQDKEEIGVQFSQKRNCTAADLSTKTLDANKAISVAIEESLDLLADSEDSVVAVVCGREEEACLSLEVLSKHPHVGIVIPIYACPGIPYFNNGTYDFEPMYDCERNLIRYFEALSNEDEDLTLDGLFIDLATPLSMIQILASVWAVPEHREEFLEDHYVVAMPYDVQSDPKRKRFMDLFRKLVHTTVTTMAEISFQGSTSQQEYLGWRVLTVDDPTAVNSISEMKNRLQKRLPQTDIKLTLLEGGRLHTPTDLLLEERSFRPEDYDYGPNQKQMAEQRPLGRQTLFQLEKSTTNEVSASIMPSMDELISALMQTMKSMGYYDAKKEKSEQLLLFSHGDDDVGNGAVVTTVFEQGSLVMVWDGLEHVDINLFCLDESRELADRFLAHFLQSVDQHHHRLERSLRDDQPRGIGRVVNFQNDMIRLVDAAAAAARPKM